jgi:hypothetical protein
VPIRWCRSQKPAKLTAFAIPAMAGCHSGSRSTIPVPAIKFLAEIKVKRGCGKLFASRRQDNSKVFKEADDIARPADRDRRRPKRVFQDQIPADDPGDKFA